MDLTAVSGKLTELLKKYRYVILVVLIGIGLMAIPTRTKDTQRAETKTEEQVRTDPSDQLTDILSQIHGAGKVRVLLTLEAGERTVYQTDQDEHRIDTVIVTDEDRAQLGLVQQVLSPEYRGAVIVCQGADDPSVRLAIVDAVSDATGLTTDRICVLKMK